MSDPAFTGKEPGRCPGCGGPSELELNAYTGEPYSLRCDACVAALLPLFADALPAAEPEAELPGLQIVTASAFAAVDEASADPLLGDDENTVLAAGGTLLFFGDGGAGKSTLMVDIGLHLATGQPWQRLPVPRPVRVAIIENEGPRGKFRRKVRSKLAAWPGPDPGDRLLVLTEPWALFSFAAAAHRGELVALIADLEIDVLIAEPILRLGVEGGGTPEEVNAFVAPMEAMRGELPRPLAYILATHENKAGGVSGAWEGVPDTLAHVTAQGNGATRVFWQKVRWGSDLHGTAWKLLWRDGEGFEIDETPELTDEDIEEAILRAVRANPGASMRTIEKAVSGRSERQREVRDRLLESGAILNLGGESKFKLYLPDDPLVEQARPDRVPPGTRSLFGPGSDGVTVTASAGDFAERVPRPDVSKDAGDADADAVPTGEPDAAGQVTYQEVLAEGLVVDEKEDTDGSVPL